MVAIQANAVSSGTKRTPLAYFLSFIFVLFLAILAAVYLITRQSNPVMLDEHGRPVASGALVPSVQTQSGFIS